MGMMQKINENLGKAFAVFAGLFILYIIFDWGMDFTGRRHQTAQDEVGVINGKKITYKEFSEKIRQTSENYKQQTGTDPDEETARQLRMQVWNEEVTNALFEQEMDRLGIIVTDQEIVDIVRGPNPPEFLVRQFRDSTGRFNRAAYESAINDARNKQIMVSVEDALRIQRKREKLQTMLTACVRISEGELQRRYQDQNVSMTADFVVFDANAMVPDSAVTVTDGDMQKYYNEKQEDFKVAAARKVSYVLFSTAPSKADSQEIIDEMKNYRSQAEQGVAFEQLAKTYSEDPAKDAFLKHGEMGREQELAVFAARTGEIVGPVADANGYHLIKVLETRKGTAEYIHVSHILLRSVGPDTASTIKRIRELHAQAKGGADFAALARENSQDGSAPMGGDLGWTAKGSWVKPFEDAAWKARVGEIVGPVRTQFGWHIIKVIARDNREAKIARITRKVKASSQTMEEANQLASDFAEVAKNEGFDKAAQSLNMKTQETPEFIKGTYIPGLGQSDIAMHFAFNNKLNEVSEAMTVTGGYAVMKISMVREEGFRPLEDVKPMVKNQALRAKKLDVIRERVEAFAKPLNNNSDIVAAAAGMPQVIGQRNAVFKAADYIPVIGNDPAFTGTALSLKPGELSKPFKAARGYVLMKLIAKTSVDSAKFATEKAGLREQLLQEKRNRFFSEWMTALRDQASIEDNRYKFYR